jgi:hypothetical protein
MGFTGSNIPFLPQNRSIMRIPPSRRHAVRHGGPSVGKGDYAVRLHDVPWLHGPPEAAPPNEKTATAVFRAAESWQLSAWRKRNTESIITKIATEALEEAIGQPSVARISAGFPNKFFCNNLAVADVQVPLPKQ